MLGYFKWLLTLIGAQLSDHALLQLQAFVNYLRIGRWMRNHRFFFPDRVSSREEVWDAMIAKVRDQKILYVEFGVAFGDSIRYWSRGLKNPASALHGFDSFEGLPEQAGPWSKGQFDASGRVPTIGDSRVTFFKGWFDQVLPHYHLPPHDGLVINMDADLYSSTIFVLNYLRLQIRPGTLIYFDEMNHVDHEPRAFDEFNNQNGIKFRPFCADKTLAHVSFECVN
jgi:Macrocin-O-methyltransferase (TylF)